MSDTKPKRGHWFHLAGYLPIAESVRTYQRAWLRFDLLAAFTVWALAVPQNLAYASIAGVPPEAGLYTALGAIFLFAIFASSRHLVVGPSSTVAVISATFIASLAPNGPSEYLALTSAMALLVGIFFILAGVARLGFITEFFAKPVLDGFIIGLALTVALGQFDKLFGVNAVGSNFFLKAWDLITQFPDFHMLSMYLGFGSLVLILGIKWFNPKVPGALIAVVVTILLVGLLGLDKQGVAIVGNITAGLPPLGVPQVGVADVVGLVPGAFAIILVGFAESIATGRTFAAKYGYKISANQEMIALGAANLGAGFSQGFVVDGSLSKTAAADQAGAKTQVAGLIHGGLILITVVALTPLFKNLAEATLGAVVVAALLNLIDFRKFKELYEVSKTDLSFALVAMLGVLSFGLLAGLVLAVILSFIALIWRTSRPGTAVLGRDPQENVYRDIERHPEFETFPGLLIFRFDSEMFFANANYFRDTLADLIASADSPVKAVIIDAESIHGLDTTATAMLKELHTELSDSGIVLMLARVHGAVADMLERSDLMKTIGEDRVFPSVRAGVAHYLSQSNNRSID